MTNVQPLADIYCVLRTLRLRATRVSGLSVTHTEPDPSHTLLCWQQGGI
uniref:Uncharacterized protein n=1 Tax=Anguilla anguilla TaxID=7936 RepID=A0A0E9UT67_ANGAN